jgi:uncharacterized membrane protein YjgN (DUF898 family)
MKISCPECSFSKVLDESKIPKSVKFKATCPKCATVFTINRPVLESTAETAEAPIAVNDVAPIAAAPALGVTDSSGAELTEATSVTEQASSGQASSLKETSEPVSEAEPPKAHLTIVETPETPETETTTEAVDEEEGTAKAQTTEEGNAAPKGIPTESKEECCGDCSGECDDSGSDSDDASHHDHADNKDSVVSIKTKSTRAEKRAEKVALKSAKKEQDKNPTKDRTENGDGGPRSLSFHGTGRTLFGIYIVNMLLSIATLGVYFFWGKAKVRRYLFSASAFMGERFSYTGTGKELFRGKIRATGLLFIVFGPPNLLSNMVHPALGLLAIPAILLFPPIARTLTMRYRMSRSNWRNIQFSFRGGVGDAIKLYMLGTLKSIVTLGFHYPKYYIDKQAFWRSNTWYGAETFKYDGEAKGVRKTIVTGSLLTILTFGLYGFWLSAKLARHNWAHTTYKGLRFRFTATGKDVFKYQIANILLLVFTLGLAMAWVQKRKIDFNFRHLKIEGDIDFAEVEQSAENAKATGESLAPGLDIDFAI